MSYMQPSAVAQDRIASNLRLCLLPFAQALLPVQIQAGNEGMLVVRGQDLRRFFTSVQKTSQRLDAQSLQQCFVNTGAGW
jgi:hypothetical protein